MSVMLSALPDIPLIREGDDLGEIIYRSMQQNFSVKSHDIICVAHKIVSKAEGALIDLNSVRPSKRATQLARDLNKRPEKVEVILQESSRVIRSFKHAHAKEGVIITQHRLGFISANAGVDESNVGADGKVLLLPKDPDASAAKIGAKIETLSGCQVGVIVTDTFGRPWRVGQVNVAIGLYRVPSTRSEIGSFDAWGNPLRVTEPAFGDEIAAASGLVITKQSRTPVTLLRGLKWKPHLSVSALSLVRNPKEDMFQ